MGQLHYEINASGAGRHCTRCGGDARTFLPSDQAVVVLDEHDQPVCNDCLTMRERIAHGEYILARLEKKADAIRVAWLGADYAELNIEEVDRRASERGPVPDELRALVSRSDDLEDLIETMRFSADSDERLLHHAVRGCPARRGISAAVR